MTSKYVNTTQRHILESYIIDFFFSMKRIHMHMHMHTNDSINERYVKFLLTKFDKLVYHVKICIDQQKNEISDGTE